MCNNWLLPLVLAIGGMCWANQPGRFDASKFGFDPDDATSALQMAINTKARIVFVPNMGTDWIIRPVFLNSSNQEIQFAKGVVVTAKRGQFHANADSLFTAFDQNNITITGYGAVLRMWKQDYTASGYTKSESRCGIRLYTVENILIQGLVIRDTGGDGIYIGINKHCTNNKNIHIKDVLCDNNHRQGISIIDAENLVIENCILSNTAGTPPESGIDFEPDYDYNRLINCVVRNCVFEGNHGQGLLVWPYRNTNDVSGSVENCTFPFKSNYIYGIQLRRRLPSWTIKNCIFINNGIHASAPDSNTDIYVKEGSAAQ